MRGLDISLEPVAYISYCLNEGMLGVFNLTSESSDVDIYGSIATVIIIAPDLVEQSFTAKDPTSTAGQELK